MSNISFYLAKTITGKGRSRVSKSVSKAAIFAISVGVAVMLLSVSASLGFQKAIKEKLSSFGGNINLLAYDNTISNYQQPISADDLKLVSKNSYIIGIQKTGNTPGIIVNEYAQEGVILKGFDESIYKESILRFLEKGKIPIYISGAYNDSILISTTTAKNLQVGVGDKLRMYFLSQKSQKPLIRAFKVAGIFASDIKDIDENFVLGDLTHVQKINNWSYDQIGNAEIFLKDIDDTEKVNNELHSIIPFELKAESFLTRNDQIIQWIALFDANVYIIIGVMCLVCIVNMITLLLVFVIENTTLIGMLKTIGLSNAKLRQLFAISVTRMLFWGLIWGNIISLLVIFVQKKFKIIQLNPESYYVKYAPLDFEWGWILGLNLFVIIIIFLAVQLPSYIISKIEPSQVLKFD